MKTFVQIALTLTFAGAVQAQDVNITPDMHSVVIETGSGTVTILRNQDTQATIVGDFARIARPCPNFCIQPMIPAEGVRPVGELEVIAALEDPRTLVLDGRVRGEFEAGTIPGAISVPYNEAADRLGELGCEIDFEGWICDGELPQVVLFCNGPWCGQSPTAARNMIEAGFPAENINYYRGGMQSWQMLGLTVVQGK